MSAAAGLRRRELLGGGAALLAPMSARAQERAPAPPVTQALTRFIVGGEPIPEAVLELARLHVLDTLASVVACRKLDAAVLARRWAREQSGEARANAVTILGVRDRAALIDAVFASAMTAHAAEINDFIPSALVQPGPAIVSAAFGLAERHRLAGAALLRAVAIGYELAGRMPKALGLANLNRSGLASHGVGPVFGVTGAAASMLRLSEPQVEAALSYASQQAAGSWQWLLDVRHVEKAFVFAGLGARAGLQAATFAQAGFTGVGANLDRAGGWLDQGMFTAAGGDFDRRKLIDGLGARWELPLTAFKRFPTGGPTQPAVQGLLQLLPELRAETVRSVRIEMPDRWQAFRDAEMPALNLRYLAAIILLDRRLDFTSAQSLARMRDDPAVRALMQRVEVAHDPAQEAPRGAERTESARVIVFDTAGRRHDAFVPYVLGFPSHPMRRADVEAKARELMAPSLGGRRAGEVIAACARLDRLPTVEPLIRLLAA